MKHLSIEDIRLMREMATELGVPLSEDDADLLASHLDWLLETNPKINLTAITEPKAAIRLHVADSIAAAPELRASPPGLLLDLGTGGGYPGYPLSIVGRRTAVLLDSVAKKARVLQEYLDSVSSESTAVAARAEDRAKEQPGAYSVVVARAVAPLPSLIELARPLLLKSGRLICLKGQPEDSEIKAGLAVADICGMRMVSNREFGLPGGEERRRILVFEVVGKSRVRLPRGIGKAQHQPLA